MVGSVMCSDAHTCMPNMSGCMQHAGHSDGGGQCGCAHTDRPVVSKMHDSMPGHAGNVPVQSDAAGTHACRLGTIVQAIAEGISAGMVKALGSVGALGVGHACMHCTDESMQQQAVIVQSDASHGRTRVSESQPAADDSVRHEVHARDLACGAFEQPYAASTGRATHGGVPVRQSTVERRAEPQPAAELQPAAWIGFCGPRLRCARAAVCCAHRS